MPPLPFRRFFEASQARRGQLIQPARLQSPRRRGKIKVHNKHKPHPRHPTRFPKQRIAMVAHSLRARPSSAAVARRAEELHDDDRQLTMGVDQDDQCGVYQ